MSKKFKDKDCVYCGAFESASTADHVVARGFFRPIPDNIPKVPCCPKCNTKKSCIEQQLMVTTAFGTRHTGALAYLNGETNRRLLKNHKLRNELGHSVRPILVEENGLILPSISMAFDAPLMLEYLQLVAVGLAFAHWGKKIGGRKVISSPILRKSERLCASFIGDGGVHGDLGGGKFRYRGFTCSVRPSTTLWLFDNFGGCLLTGQGESSSQSMVITDPPTDDPPLTLVL